MTQTFQDWQREHGGTIAHCVVVEPLLQEVNQHDCEAGVVWDAIAINEAADEIRALGGYVVNVLPRPDISTPRRPMLEIHVKKAHEECEFCGQAGEILPQDMGERRTMWLCASCRQHIADGLVRDQLGHE